MNGWSESNLFAARASIRRLSSSDREQLQQKYTHIAITDSSADRQAHARRMLELLAGVAREVQRA